MGKKIKEGEQKERKNKGETILSFFFIEKTWDGQLVTTKEKWWTNYCDEGEMKMTYTYACTHTYTHAHAHTQAYMHTHTHTNPTYT